MPNSMNNPEIEDLPIGTGLAQGAKDIALWRRKWQEEFVNGQTDLQFRDWLKQFNLKSPTLPREME